MIMDGGPMVGWLENAFSWSQRTPLEVTVKNMVAQVTKEFYGFGPRVASRCLVSGRIILYLTPLSGSVALTELAARPAGRVVIDYNNRLLIQRYREPFARLAAAALGTDLTGFWLDFDEGSGQVAGVVLLDHEIGEAGAPAPPEMREMVGSLLGSEALSSWTFYAEPGLCWGTGPSLSGDVLDPSGDWGDLERGRAWRQRRETVAEPLRERWRHQFGYEPVVVLGDDGCRSIVALLLPGGGTS